MCSKLTGCSGISFGALVLSNLHAGVALDVCIVLWWLPGPLCFRCVSSHDADNHGHMLKLTDAEKHVH